jgi:FkbM family methyltransferase
LGVSERALHVVERLPALQKLAFNVFHTYRKARSALLDIAVTTSGSYCPRSMSDRGQDRWVIDEVFHGKRGGFFLELGAVDGFQESNTYVLEKRFGWQGLCIEAHPALFRRLTKKRSCTCVPYAVDAEHGRVEFMLSGQTSGVIAEESDNSPERRPKSIQAARTKGQIVSVETWPLDALLDKYGAPRTIDYFSFDVEGLETRILRGFPFHKYTFLSMTIERPTPELNQLLFRNGYHFVRNSIYDTFYVHETLPGFADVRRDPFVQLPAKLF